MSVELIRRCRCNRCHTLAEMSNNQIPDKWLRIQLGSGDEYFDDPEDAYMHLCAVCNRDLQDFMNGQQIEYLNAARNNDFAWLPYENPVKEELPQEVQKAAEEFNFGFGGNNG